MVGNLLDPIVVVGNMYMIKVWLFEEVSLRKIQTRKGFEFEGCLRALIKTSRDVYSRNLSYTSKETNLYF